MKRKYSSDRITVCWDSDKCIRSGLCDGQLPQVFDVNRRPWVDVNAACVEEIKRVIDTCPSGALTYEVPGQAQESTVIIVQKSGPYKVRGTCRLVNSAGEEIECGGTFALCRCGASKKMPFCDGSHYRGLLKE